MKVSVSGKEQELNVGDFVEARAKYGSIIKFIRGEVVELKEYTDCFTLMIYCVDEFGSRIVKFNSSKGTLEVIRK